jgi:hypothetical protein
VKENHTFWVSYDVSAALRMINHLIFHILLPNVWVHQNHHVNMIPCNTAMIIPRDRNLPMCFYIALLQFSAPTTLSCCSIPGPKQTLTNSISLLCQQTWTSVNSTRDFLLKLQWRRWLRPRWEARIPGGSLRQIAAGNLQISRWDRSLSNNNNNNNKWGIFITDPHHECDDVDQW